MKCDEVKPQCGPCAKGNRPCVYGAPVSEIDSNSRSSQPYYHNSGNPNSPVNERTPRTSIASEQSDTDTNKQWSAQLGDEAMHMTSPQSTYSNSTGMYRAVITCPRAFAPSTLGPLVVDYAGSFFLTFARLRD